MRTILLSSVLLLALVTAGMAEEIVSPMGDRWYLVQLPEAVVIPDTGVIGPVMICLDEVPGGLDSTPAIDIVPVEKNKGHKRTISMTREKFAPITDDAGNMAYVSYVLRGVPGTAFWLGAVVRGKQ